MLYIPLDEAKLILKHLAMESAMENVGIKVDASVAFESCAERLGSWLDLVPAYELQSLRCMQRVPYEMLSHIRDYEELVKTDISQKLAQRLVDEGKITFTKTEEPKQNQVVFEGRIRFLKNEVVVKCDT